MLLNLDEILSFNLNPILFDISLSSEAYFSTLIAIYCLLALKVKFILICDQLQKFLVSMRVISCKGVIKYLLSLSIPIIDRIYVIFLSYEFHLFKFEGSFWDSYKNENETYLGLSFFF
jgi:hypothetical protein